MSQHHMSEKDEKLLQEHSISGPQVREYAAKQFLKGDVGRSELGVLDIDRAAEECSPCLGRAHIERDHGLCGVGA